MIKNANGKVYYGMHFYPGVAEYAEPGKEPYRIFINEDTIRKMDATFAGRPIFVEHVDEVESNIDELRKEADGWVVESFYNQADGKHWVKFIVVSERGERAIRNGFRLSNAYIPQGPYGNGGLWNGVSYAKEVLGGEFEHLAIVRNPRYEESVIMTPEEFKLHNENLQIELKKIANSNQKEKQPMKLSFFKKAKVENSADLEGICVLLPLSKKEMAITDLVTEMDKIQNMHGYASGDHMVKVGENEMSVNDLVKKHMDMCNEMEEMKKPKENEEMEEGEVGMSEEGVDSESAVDNEEEKGAKEKVDKEDEDKKKNEEMEEKKKNALAAKKKNFDAMKNAHLNVKQEVARVDLAEDRVARGKARYGAKA